MRILATIRQLAAERLARTISDRRYLHAHPELSFSEHETAAFIRARLDELGIPWESLSGTGVVGKIEGGIPSGGVLALRADMDALPITELNNCEFVSRNNGVMHACGHDAHTASLLATASILQSLKTEWTGTVKLIFQPAEEKLPGGASLMIADGVLTRPAPVAVLGQHVWPFLEAGKVAVRGGLCMASMDEITIRVYGKGGHGAMPHINIDPVVISAELILALQQVISRNNNPLTPGVLSFGRVIADGAINVIPDMVELQGTFRTVDEKWRYVAHGKMKEMAGRLAVSMGGSCEFDIVCGYPSLFNDEKVAAEVEGHAVAYLGRGNVVKADLLMAAEDFAYYSRAVPSCFYFLGTGNADQHMDAPLHSPRFAIDESALEVSTGLMAYLALKQLGN